MSAVLIEDYFENLRTALADQAESGVYAWSDESLSGALKSVVQMGMGPRGVEVSDDGLSLDPAPETPDARGYLVMKAALLLIGGQVPVGMRTRGIQFKLERGEREVTVNHLRRQIKYLETKGDPHGNGGASFFGVWVDMENGLRRAGPRPKRVDRRRGGGR